jgi:hypothetical protein
MRPSVRRALYAATTLLVVLLLLEIAARLLVAPSSHSYGRFFGQELPPLELIPYDSSPGKTDRNAPFGDLVVDGRQISIGDLWGFHRDDPLLGYAPEESTVSLNRWWQSNNIGARKRLDTPSAVAPGTTRLLVFGDSYAQATRVKQEQAWPAVLETSRLETINFGVDGYGMAQSYLRYRQVKNSIEHDLVLLLFVPIKDLWRDVNTIRSLAKDWDYYPVMPRFVLEQDELVLIESPYERNLQVFEENSPVVSDKLETHLRRYDRFFFETEYRQPRLFGRLVLYKLPLRVYLTLRKRALYGRLDADSEAVQVTGRIFEAMAEEVEREGARFILVYLPSRKDLKLLRSSSDYAANWKRIFASTCDRGFPCIDLSPALLDAAPGSLDSGYEGSHYGPGANRLIADLIRRALEERGVVEPAPRDHGS